MLSCYFSLLLRVCSLSLLLPCYLLLLPTKKPNENKHIGSSYLPIACY